jgi:hypothetical protein
MVGDHLAGDRVSPPRRSARTLSLAMLSRTAASFRGDAASIILRFDERRVSRTLLNRMRPSLPLRACASALSIRFFRPAPWLADQRARTEGPRVFHIDANSVLRQLRLKLFSASSTIPQQHGLEGIRFRDVGDAGVPSRLSTCRLRLVYHQQMQYLR